MEAHFEDRRLVSVVIPTYNRRSYLSATIRAALEDSSTGEVIVVVDGCRDGSFELLERWNREDARVRPIFQENGGEGLARETGVKDAEYDIVLMLDDDVVAGEGLVSGHARHHYDSGGRVILGYMPTQIPHPRRPGQVPTLLYAQDYEKTCDGYENDPSSILNNLWGGNMSMRREDAIRVGLYGGVRLGYHEDMHFGIRCSRDGIIPEFDRKLLATHSHRRTLRQFTSESRRSGEARASLCALYPEVSARIDPLRALPGGAATMIRILGSRWFHTVAAAIAMGVSWVGGKFGSWSVEKGSARVLRQIEMCYGFHAPRPGDSAFDESPRRA